MQHMTNRALNPAPLPCLVLHRNNTSRGHGVGLRARAGGAMMSKPTDAMRRIRENSKPEWATYKVGMTQVMRCDGCGNEVEWPHSLYRYGIKSLRRVCENCKLLQERSAK